MPIVFPTAALQDASPERFTNKLSLIPWVMNPGVQRVWFHAVWSPDFAVLRECMARSWRVPTEVPSLIMNFLGPARNAMFIQRDVLGLPPTGGFRLDVDTAYKTLLLIAVDDGTVSARRLLDTIVFAPPIWNVAGMMGFIEECAMQAEADEHPVELFFRGRGNTLVMQFRHHS